MSRSQASSVTPEALSNPARPPLWRVRGFYAGIDWVPSEGRYVASVPNLPGACGSGPDRTSALRALERELQRLL